jgi:hypothetical protein
LGEGGLEAFDNLLSDDVSVGEVIHSDPKLSNQVADFSLKDSSDAAVAFVIAAAHADYIRQAVERGEVSLNRFVSMDANELVSNKLEVIQA